MGVLTDFFRATDDELRRHYPGWKVPLTEPRRVQGRNPFTGKEIERLEWDPSPGVDVSEDGPLDHPGASIDLKGLGMESVTSLVELLGGETTRAEFEKPALIGPEEGPWIFRLPPSFVTKLTSLDDAGRADVAARWSEGERADIAGIANEFTRNRMLAERPLSYWRGMLDAIADFARDAVTEKRDVFLWMSL